MVEKGRAEAQARTEAGTGGGGGMLVTAVLPISNQENASQTNVTWETLPSRFSLPNDSGLCPVDIKYQPAQKLTNLPPPLPPFLCKSQGC